MDIPECVKGSCFLSSFRQAVVSVCFIDYQIVIETGNSLIVEFLHAYIFKFQFVVLVMEQNEPFISFCDDLGILSCIQKTLSILYFLFFVIFYALKGQRVVQI